MSKLEKRAVNTDGIGATRINNIVLKCGDCLHFKGSAHPSIGTPCSQLGVKAFGAAPPCFTANASLLNTVATETFAVLSSILTTFTPQQSRIFMGLLKSAGSLEKHGFTFLQKVYFRVGQDYLDNYYSGYVLGVGVDHSIMLVGKSYFTSAKRAVTASLLKENVLTIDQFKKLRKKLAASGKLYEPRKIHKNNIKSTDDYEPPTIETAQDLLEEQAKRIGKKRINKKGELKTLEVRIEKENKMPSGDSGDSDD